MKKYLMAANWKLHKNLDEAVAFSKEIRKATIPNDVEVLICPTSPLLYPIFAELADSNIKIGAQNVFYEKEGAYTGEISVDSLKSIGVSYAIIGHSERRKYFMESDEMLNKKLNTALSNGLRAILCVGELKEEREQDKTIDVLTRQLNGALFGLDMSLLKKLDIAYEPVWAIGTGLTATSGQAQESHSFIRNHIAKMFNSTIAENIRILYGGSVKPANVKDLMRQPDVDGALVGGASLDAKKFAEIISFRTQ